MSTDGISNENVLSKVKEGRTFLKILKRRKGNSIGNISRGKGILTTSLVEEKKGRKKNTHDRI